ncbi:MAG: restriction endonuclease [Chloroflexi bacterium]|nr:restriction endonuclease [Chloroflexota bacterium]
MAVGDSDKVRAYAAKLVEDARRKGETRITFRTGDISSRLGTQNATTSQALDGDTFSRQAVVKQIEYSGPPSRRGGNARFTFEILPVGDAIAPQDTLQENGLFTDTYVEENVEEYPASMNPTVEPSDSGDEDSLANHILERLRQLSPDQFEVLVGEYMKAKGFSDVQVTGKSYDGGIDGYCAVPFINVKVAFQAKRYAAGNSVGIDPVQRLQGSVSGGYDRGVFITTSSFTSTAIGWVEEAQAQITLIDGDELVRQMIDLGLGVRTIPVVRHEVDESFFADLENMR